MKLLLISLLLCSTYPATFGKSPQADSHSARQNGAPAATVDQGKLLIFTGGKQVGSESFSINADNSGESSDELALGGQTVKFETLLGVAQTTMKGRRFILEQSPGTRLVFDFNGGEVKLTGSREAAGQTDPEAVVLENNVWYHYYFLLRRYDQQRGGAQQFKAFVPSIMQTIPVSVVLKGAVGPFPGSSSRLNLYEVAAAGTLKIDLVADPSGKLVYIGIPSQHAEVVREEYAASIEQLRAAVVAEKTGAENKPDYSAPPGASFNAEEVTVPLKSYTLAGTLLLPKACGGPCPAIVLITGSGLQTRDEPVPIQGLEKYRPFRQVAETLASHGIAVLRVDDRGVGGSTGKETLAAVTTSGFADDTRAEVAYLRTRREIDPSRIALVGHSEGGSIAPMVAATDPRIAAIVLLAGPGKSGSEISLYQLQQVLEGQPGMTQEEREKKLSEQRELIRAVQTGGDLSKYPEQVKLPWMREFFTYDPIPTIRRVRQPILILQGAIDRQITAEQAGLLEQAARSAGNRDVTVRIFPGLNHLFLPAQTGAVSEYASLQTTSVPDDVLRVLTEWLRERLRAR
ncbi:MAG TPA: alpha/beta fold hydrolase [Pyrinomonadaceae bacterium]|jgi:hypothetical protein|nr:alpha/beta fold hydrolase [Pyrinomonadaceae bacterium]